MVCPFLFVLLGLCRFCNSSAIDWIAKDFALAVLRVAILSAVKTLLFWCNSKQCLIWFRIRRSADVDTIWPNCVTIANIPHPWPNQRELSLICGIVSEWMDCRRISVTAPEDRPLFASFFESTHSHHHVCLAVVAISSIVVAAAWGCKIWMQSNPIYNDCT